MTIIINIKEPVPKGTDCIALKEVLADMLDLYDLTVGRIDIQEVDQ